MQQLFLKKTCSDIFKVKISYKKLIKRFRTFETNLKLGKFREMLLSFVCSKHKKTILRNTVKTNSEKDDFKISQEWLKLVVHLRHDTSGKRGGVNNFVTTKQGRGIKPSMTSFISNLDLMKLLPLICLSRDKALDPYLMDSK